MKDYTNFQDGFGNFLVYLILDLKTYNEVIKLTS